MRGMMDGETMWAPFQELRAEGSKIRRRQVVVLFTLNHVFSFGPLDWWNRRLGLILWAGFKTGKLYMKWWLVTCTCHRNIWDQSVFSLFLMAQVIETCKTKIVPSSKCMTFVRDEVYLNMFFLLLFLVNIWGVLWMRYHSYLFFLANQWWRQN